MKRLAPLTLITALILAGCSSSTESAPEPAETTTDASTEAPPQTEPADESTPPNLDNLTAEEQAVLNARPDGGLYDRYSDESVVEDARHTCYHIQRNVEQGNSIALHTLDQIYSANSRSQQERSNDPAYPDDTPYIRDMEYPVEQALVHMCPEHLDEVDRDAFDSFNAFANAGMELGYTRFTEDGYEFTDE